MKIRQRNYPSGRIGWQLDCGKVDGKRVMLSFKTREHAELEMFQRRGEIKAHGQLGLILTGRQKMEVTIALDRLNEVGATITQAVEFFLKNSGARKPVKEISMEALVRECRTAKLNEGLRPRYLVQLKSTGTAFARHVGEMTPAHLVTRPDVEGWLKANEWSPVTRNNYVVDLRTIFAWAIENGHASVNPCAEIKRIKVDAEEIAFVGYDDCEKLFRRAEEPRPARPWWDEKGRRVKLDAKDEDFRDFIPMLVLGFFCGLRPERELGLITKADVKLENKLVVVTSGRAKGRKRRTVDLTANAIEWLKLGLPFLRGEGILPPNFAKRWRRLRGECGFFTGRDAALCPRGKIPWPHDGMRHTFATAHLAHHRDEAELQVLMGHTSAAMIHAHYRGLMTPQEAARFYEMRPEGK